MAHRAVRRLGLGGVGVHGLRAPRLFECIYYGLSAADYDLLNPLGDLEVAEDRISNIDLPGYDASLPPGRPEDWQIHDSTVHLGVVSLGSPAPVVDKVEKSHSKKG